VTAFAFGLVLTAAFINATWNYLAKRAGEGGAAFVWLFAAISSVFYAPVALIVFFWQKPYIGSLQLVFMAGSALIHVLYFLIIQKGYRVGDLSLVYPLARGTGPTLSTLAAIRYLGERPSVLAILGAVLVAAGVFFCPGVRAVSGGAANGWWGTGCSQGSLLPTQLNGGLISEDHLNRRRIWNREPRKRI
jgi:uncharacterized membrane protein